MRYPFTILLLLISLAAYGGGHVSLASMLKRLKRQKEDTTRVNLLAGIAEAYASQNPDEGIRYGEKALDLADRLQWKPGLIHACNSLGRNYLAKADHARAIALFRKALEEARNAENKEGIAASLRNIGQVNIALGNYAQSLASFQEARNIDEELGNKAGIARDLLLTGDVYQAQSNYVTALDYMLKALKLHEEINDRSALADNYGSIGMVYIGQGNFRAALENYRRALQMYRQTEEKSGVALNLKNIGNAYISLRIFDSALTFYNEAIAMYRELGDNSGIARNIGNIGNVYQELGDYPKALSYLLDAASKNRRLGEMYPLQNNLGSIGLIYLDIARDTTGDIPVDSLVPQTAGHTIDKKASLQLAIAYLDSAIRYDRELGNLNELQHFTLFISEAYEMAGDYKKAYEYYDLSRRTRDSVFSLNNALRFARLNENWEAENREKQIAMQQLKLRARKHENLFFFVLFATATLIAGSLLLRFRTAKRTRRQLEEKNRLINEEKEHAEMQRQRAERSEQFKREFLTSMSHELRTPMNAINGMTDLLLEKKPAPEQQKYLEVISRSSDLLIHLINDILDLSKIEAGKLTLESIDFSLSNIVSETKDHAQLLADEKGILFKATQSELLPDVLIGDPLRLHQSIDKLVTVILHNAIAGEVTLSVLPAAQPYGLYVKIAALDTGIPPDILRKMMDMTSGTNESATYDGGLLGVEIARHLISLAGGALRAEALVNGGILLQFEMPFEAGSADRLLARGKSDNAAGAPSLDGLRVLLVDDNDYNRLVAHETLQSRARMTIDEAVNGHEAIEKLRQNDYDIVLMDVQMPVMNGLDATRYIRSELPPPKNKVPIIALTASLLPDDIGICKEAGMDTYVPKPFKAAELVATMAEVMRNPAS